MFKIIYKKTGKEIELKNKTMWLLLDHKYLEELGFKLDDLWNEE